VEEAAGRRFAVKVKTSYVQKPVYFANWRGNEVAPAIEQKGLPVSVAAEEGKVGPEDEAGIVTWLRIDLIPAAVV